MYFKNRLIYSQWVLTGTKTYKLHNFFLNEWTRTKIILKKSRVKYFKEYAGIQIII